MPSARRTGFAAVLALVSAFAASTSACATAEQVEPTGAPDTNGSPNLPAPESGTPARNDSDGACTRSTDCPAPAACNEAACIDKKCVERPIKCEGGSECAPSVCDPATSACVTTPAADRTACDKGFGQCVEGKCEKLSSCFGDSPMQYIHCDGTTYRDLSTGLYPTSRVSTYACASGQTTNEVALEFDPPANANVTVTLAVTDAADADLDLVVLEGDCTGAAACAGSSVTAGTGTESATFTAKPSTKYYVVIDGKVTAPTKFRVNVDCK
jgi:hypothetical protein